MYMCELPDSIVQTILFLLGILIKQYTSGLVQRILGPFMSVMRYSEVSSGSFTNQDNTDLMLIPFQSKLQWNLMVSLYIYINKLLHKFWNLRIVVVHTADCSLLYIIHLKI